MAREREMNTCAVVRVESREFMAIGMRVIGPAGTSVVIVVAKIDVVLERNLYMSCRTVCRIISARSVECVFGNPKEHKAALQMSRAIVGVPTMSVPGIDAAALMMACWQRRSVLVMAIITFWSTSQT